MERRFVFEALPADPAELRSLPEFGKERVVSDVICFASALPKLAMRGTKPVHLSSNRSSPRSCGLTRSPGSAASSRLSPKPRPTAIS